MTKIVVIGGTHEREIGFSYPTIDLILKRFDIRSSPEEFSGADDARKSLLWNINDNLSAAKVVKTGPMSRKYVESLAPDERRYYAMMLVKAWSPLSIFEPAHVYFSTQWTSVHQHIIDESDADFYIDLHSWHSATKGQNGTSMDINSYALPKFNRFIEAALFRAKTRESATFGTHRQNPYAEYGNSRKESQMIAEWGNSWDFKRFGEKHHWTNEHALRRIASEAYIMGILDVLINPEEQVELLSTDPAQLDAITMRIYKNRLSALKEDAEDIKNQSEMMKPENKAYRMLYDWKNHQYFMPSYFLFEAIRWQEEQQRATEHFISDYLVPEIRDYGMKE